MDTPKSLKLFKKNCEVRKIAFSDQFADSKKRRSTGDTCVIYVPLPLYPTLAFLDGLLKEVYAENLGSLIHPGVGVHNIKK